MTTLEQMAAELAEQDRWALFREYAETVRRVEGQHLYSLMSLGAPRDFWINCGAPAPAPIRPLPEGRFEFTDGGDAAVILPVYDSQTPAWAPLEQRFEGLLDLLAFDPGDPDRWWLRRGQAVLLGSIYVSLALEARCALPVYSNAPNWLQADGEGVMVLDWAMAPALLCDVEEFLAENVDLGTRLETALRPEIWVMEAVA